MFGKIRIGKVRKHPKRRQKIHFFVKNWLFFKYDSKFKTFS